MRKQLFDYNYQIHVVIRFESKEEALKIVAELIKDSNMENIAIADDRIQYFTYTTVKAGSEMEGRKKAETSITNGDVTRIGIVWTTNPQTDDFLPPHQFDD